MSTETNVNSLHFKKECKGLLDIYKLKGYRRYNQFFKAKYNHKWKKECSLAEFVWNYCKTPRYAAALMDHLDTVVLDEHDAKKWLTNANDTIDPEITFADFEAGITYLSENPDVTFVHVLGEGTDLSEDPCVFYIDGSEGDLFHGVVFDAENIDIIDHIVFTIDTSIGAYSYIITSEDINSNVCVLQEDADTKEPLLYYLPFFKHPIPLVHLTDHQVKLNARIVMESDAEDIDCEPLLTILNSRLQNWLKNRSLLLTLRESDLLRVGPKRMRILENQ